jgi:hypothetical protein
MATFNDLVRAIAEIEGMDPMTVRGIGIKIREAGMISKSGRGLSAARMTVEDAAALLIGVNGTAMAKDAAEAIHAFRNLRLQLDYGMPTDPGERSEILGESDPIDRTLKIGTPFQETLVALLTACVPQEDGTTYLSRRLGSDVSVNITFHRPVWSASIDIYWEATNEEELPEPWTSAQFVDPPATLLTETGPDRSDSTTISARTLMAVGQILAT